MLECKFDVVRVDVILGHNAEYTGSMSRLPILVLECSKGGHLEGGSCQTGLKSGFLRGEKWMNWPENFMGPILNIVSTPPCFSTVFQISSCLMHLLMARTVQCTCAPVAGVKWFFKTEKRSFCQAWEQGASVSGGDQAQGTFMSSGSGYIDDWAITWHDSRKDLWLRCVCLRLGVSSLLCHSTALTWALHSHLSDTQFCLMGLTVEVACSAKAGQVISRELFSFCFYSSHLGQLTGLGVGDQRYREYIE